MKEIEKENHESCNKISPLKKEEKISEKEKKQKKMKKRKRKKK